MLAAGTLGGKRITNEGYPAMAPFYSDWPSAMAAKSVDNWGGKRASRTTVMYGAWQSSEGLRTRNPPV